MDNLLLMNDPENLDDQQIMQMINILMHEPKFPKGVKQLLTSTSSVTKKRDILTKLWLWQNVIQINYLNVYKISNRFADIFHV